MKQVRIVSDGLKHRVIGPDGKDIPMVTECVIDPILPHTAVTATIKLHCRLDLQADVEAEEA